jgi:HPt (histidine-containing phosphotransfer) domain-containing protein
MSPATIDPEVFAALQEDAGAEFVRELVQTFLEEAPLMLEDLRRSLADGDADGFRRAAHSLKSNGLTFGATRLGALARELELGGLARARQPGAVEALEAEYGRAAAALPELAGG